MGLKVGIVGLPNVGKSTLFKSLTKQPIEIANYPFATINPNVGIVKVPDPRTDVLQQLYNSEKIVPCVIEFVDIAGLVKGASEGKGLGNQFLSNIRDCDVICNVIRYFENNDIIHVDGNVNPLRDLETINLELIISDLDYLEKRIRTLTKKNNVIKSNTLDPNALMQKAKLVLEKNQMLSAEQWTKEEKHFLSKECNLITIKNAFTVVNVSESDLNVIDSNNSIKELKTKLVQMNLSPIFLCLNFENEISELSDEDQKLMLNEYKLNTNAIDRVIRKGFEVLDLSTFFTCGPKEIHAWNYKNGSTAFDCAGEIHTDIQKGFIRAEVIKYKDIVEYKTETKVKEAGKFKVESKDYIMEDGDICFFRFNV